MGSLEGTVALVTGASSGIGQATARTLAERGAGVALVARRGDRLQELAGAIADAGGTALAVEADITEREQAEAAVAKAVEELGRLDILVNSAGLMLLGPIPGAEAEDWDRMIDLNLKGLLYTARAALPHLLEATGYDPRRVADLVNVSSVAGRVVRKGQGVYNATKFAVGAFSEALRQEVTARHLRISLVEPGPVSTELFEQNRPEVHDHIKERLADIDILQAADIADAISYIVTRPRHVVINELTVRPTAQDV